MHTIASTLYHAFLAVISPPFCTHCGTFLPCRAVLCDPCCKKIKPIVTKLVPVTGKYPVTLFAISSYEDPLKSLILAKSYRDHVASAQLGQLVWELTDIRNVPFDCIVPIPLHWRRFAKRGYNQTAEIARIIAQKSGKPLINALKRTTHRPFQAQVERDERDENVKGAFILKPHKKELLAGKHVLIVDDLFTTGATMKTATRELIRSKPSQITAVVACRTR